MFGHIVPCGLDLPVTSLAAEGLAISMDQLSEAVVSGALGAWGGRGHDRQDVVAGPADAAGASGERLPLRRLRQAGVDPGGGLALDARKPPWLRVPARMGTDFLGLGRTVHDLGLVTVCEEAGCPNIFECWADGTATFMVNGSRCTRACGFCLVDTSRPLPLDPGEPERVAEAVARMGLAHAVVTCVARDDLPDGGAGALAATVAGHPGPPTRHHRRAADLGLQGRRLGALARSSTPGPTSSTTTSRRWPACSGPCGPRPATRGACRCWPGRPTPASP